MLATYTISSTPILEFGRKWTSKFLISQTTVTLNERPDHQNLYQNVELNGLYHKTKFERNQSVNV